MGLAAWAAAEDRATFGQAWDCSFGRLVEAVRFGTEQDEVLTIAVSAAMHLAYSGWAGSWSVHLPQATSLRFGKWVFGGGAAVYPATFITGARSLNLTSLGGS